MPNVHLEPVRGASSFRRIAAVAWDEPRDPTILGTIQVRAEKLNAWLEAQSEATGEKLTITHAVARAVGMVFRRHPDFNCLVRWGNLYRRRDVDVFVQVVIPDETRIGKADLSGVVVRNADTKSIDAISKEVRAGASRIRSGDDRDFERTKGQANATPGVIFRWVLRLLCFLQYALNINPRFLGAPQDPFGSVMVTSVGMMGLSLGWAPFFPLGRCPCILLVGALEDVVMVEDGQMVIRKTFRINGTMDHRVIDGFHAAVLAREIANLLEDPERLEDSAV